MSWKDEINKTKSIKRLKRFDEQAGDTRESMLDYAVYEILTLVKNRSEVSRRPTSNIYSRSFCIWT